MKNLSLSNIIYGVVAVMIFIFVIKGFVEYMPAIDAARTEAAQNKGYENPTDEQKSKVKLSSKVDNQVKGAVAGDAMVTLSMILLFAAIAGAVALPVFTAVKEGQLKGLVYMAAAGGILLVLFGIGYLMASNEPYEKYGVDASGSQMIGGLLGMVYILAIVAILGIVANIFAKRFN
ncbi:hypothetical protein [Hugenholtzia roseola]|uniref:hypothetical protein n=1 Tax=Hugenholtzia roseola TaxID=1002 RepID=UPI00041D154D|nr:hypothetical protein [Hugenholtzia roseola]